MDKNFSQFKNKQIKDENINNNPNNPEYENEKLKFELKGKLKQDKAINSDKLFMFI